MLVPSKPGSLPWPFRVVDWTRDVLKNYSDHRNRGKNMIGNGKTVDFYDDGGQVLREKFGDALPDFIKQAEVLTEEDLDNLPDHAFAVVLIDGSEKMRKFACVDKAHTAINAIYFMENPRSLPYEARGIAAHNIKVACKRHGLGVPDKLLKVASRAKKLIDMDGAVPMMSKKKQSELSGTEIMPLSSAGSRRLKKIASETISPYIDVNKDTQPVAFRRPKVAYALEDTNGPQFPLESYSQVKEAAEFFEQQGKRFHPRSRHNACVKIAARADVLGVPIGKVVRQYGSPTFGPDGQIKVGFETRRQMFRSDEGSTALLDSLMEKKASAGPEEFAEALAQVDIALGLSRYWGKGVMDPWATTFGQTKVAEWSWSHGNEKLEAKQLQNFVKEGPGRSALERSFGTELADAMSKNPTSIFDSLPLEQKIVIARLAYQG